MAPCLNARVPIPAPESIIAAFERSVPLVAYFLVSILVVAYPLGVERHLLLDQQDYLEYFRIGPSMDWLQGYFDADIWWRMAVNFIADEILWRMWTLVVGGVLSPDAAIQFTVFMMNLLLVLAFWHLRHNILALALWVVSPVALVVVGLIQIRQGFAFAVFVYGALALRRPVISGLVAALVHTTFAVPLFFAGVAWICGARRWLVLVLAPVLALLLALSGRLLFELLGGRRLQIYSATEGADSINYVLMALIFVVPSAVVLFQGRARREIQLLAASHWGTVSFTIASFFVFPLGTSRVGYFIHLLMIPVLCSLRINPLSLAAIFGPVVLAMSYLAGKSFSSGEYAHLFWM